MGTNNAVRDAKRHEEHSVLRQAWTDVNIKTYMALDLLLYEHAVAVHAEQVATYGLTRGSSDFCPNDACASSLSSGGVGEASSPSPSSGCSAFGRGGSLTITAAAAVLALGLIVVLCASYCVRALARRICRGSKPGAG